jgi:hypothetical protein
MLRPAVHHAVTRDAQALESLPGEKLEGKLERRSMIVAVGLSFGPGRPLPNPGAALAADALDGAVRQAALAAVVDLEEGELQ